MNTSDDLLEYVRRCIVVMEPEHGLLDLVQTVGDIYRERHILKQLPCNDFTIGHLVGITRDALDRGARVRRFEVFKVIRAVIRNDQNFCFSQTVIDDLFAIYQATIFAVKEDVRWCVSTFVKDQLLSDEQISWLIQNYRRSVHIVNRLLKYPEANLAIRDWARGVYERGELQDRVSEVLSVGYADTLHQFSDREEAEAIAWAVYRAGIGSIEKETLLKKLASRTSAPTIAEIALRLGYTEVLKHLHEVLGDG
jgi:hypothetical protein